MVEFYQCGGQRSRARNPHAFGTDQNMAAHGKTETTDFKSIGTGSFRFNFI